MRLVFDGGWDDWWLKKRGSFPVFELGGRGEGPQFVGAPSLVRVPKLGAGRPKALLPQSKPHNAVESPDNSSPALAHAFAFLAEPLMESPHRDCSTLHPTTKFCINWMDRIAVIIYCKQPRHPSISSCFLRPTYKPHTVSNSKNEVSEARKPQGPRCRPPQTAFVSEWPTATKDARGPPHDPPNLPDVGLCRPGCHPAQSQNMERKCLEDTQMQETNAGNKCRNNRQ